MLNIILSRDKNVKNLDNIVKFSTLCYIKWNETVNIEKRKKIHVIEN